MDPDYLISKVQEADRRFRMLAKAEPQCHLIDYSNVVALDDQTQKLFAEIGIAHDPVKAQAVLDRPLTHVKGPRLLSRGKRWAKNTFLRSGG